MAMAYLQIIITLTWNTFQLVTLYCQRPRVLALSRRGPTSYRNQSIDLLCKSMDWFLYDIGLRRERL